MDSYRRSFALYKNLIKDQENYLKGIVGTPHVSQFKVNTTSGIYYKNLYIDLVDRVRQNTPPSPPPNDQNCKNCRNHFLQKQPKIDHEKDVKIGTALEEYFCNFVNEYFKEKKLNLQCVRADTDKLNMPDFKIIDLGSGKDIFYFEFKCIFKPFIIVHKKISGAYCYNQSLTLDCDEKLITQKKLINDNQILEKTAYVYWYDIPCLKGVFWQFSKDVFEYEESASTYKRREQVGDYINGNQVGHIDKIYLAIQQMNNFDSFFQQVIKLQNS